MLRFHPPEGSTGRRPVPTRPRAGPPHGEEPCQTPAEGTQAGKRAVTVFLHAPWSGYEGYDSASRHPADGIIDALLLTIGPHPVAFDLDPGPFGQLRVRDAVYRHGYDDFRLGQFCDGWIYRKPISTFEGVTPVADWINEDNLDRARLQSPNPAYRQASAKEFNSAIARSADIPARWGFLR